MKILFLHPNFPAQFREPCTSLAKETKHDVLFLCQTHYGRVIPGVKKLVLKGRGSHDRTLESSKNENDRNLYRASAYREAFISLKNSGWCPDIVFSHCGWGCGIYTKDIWPDCRLVAYMEWWFDPKSKLQQRLKQNQYYCLSEDSNAKLTIRNLPACYEMVISDEIVSPTAWQRQQLPKLLQKNCRVIQDQIDRGLFFPEPQKQSPSPVLTYGTRGMEPIRGFPEFIKCLPVVLKKWPQLRAEIAGLDRINYGGLKPKEGSWKKWAIALLEEHNLNDRVSWKGCLPIEAYANWLKGSWCHVYLSEPFVTSWSLIEACHCSVPMVAPLCPAIEEFSHLNPLLIQVEYSKADKLVEAINDRIRFSSNFSRDARTNRGSPQAKSAIYPQMTLASLISDVEAATSD